MPKGIVENNGDIGREVLSGIGSFMITPKKKGSNRAASFTKKTKKRVWKSPPGLRCNPECQEITCMC